MSKNEGVHSVYFEFMSNWSQIYTVIAGFMYTAITILVTLLPDPTQIVAQATLFSLTVFFGLCMFRIMHLMNVQSYSVRISPPLPKGILKRSMIVDNVVWAGLGVPIILMFLLWNLTYLALASLIVEALLVILMYIDVNPLWKAWKRFEAETGKKWRIRKFFDERDSIFKSED